MNEWMNGWMSKCILYTLRLIWCVTQKFKKFLCVSFIAAINRREKKRSYAIIVHYMKCLVLHTAHHTFNRFSEKNSTRLFFSLGRIKHRSRKKKWPYLTMRIYEIYRKKKAHLTIYSSEFLCDYAWFI